MGFEWNEFYLVESIFVDDAFASSLGPNETRRLCLIDMSLMTICFSIL